MRKILGLVGAALALLFSAPAVAQGVVQVVRRPPPATDNGKLAACQSAAYSNQQQFSWCGEHLHLITVLGTLEGWACPPMNFMSTPYVTKFNLWMSQRNYGLGGLNFAQITAYWARDSYPCGAQ